MFTKKLQFIPKKYTKEFVVIISSIFILIVLFITLLLLSQKTQIRQRAAISSPQPEKVKITNINSTGFTVTWITKELSIGSIVYTEEKDSTLNSQVKSPISQDERGNSNFYTHSVKINGLQAGRKYYFKILSGEKTFFKSVTDPWQEAGVPEEITLPQESSSSLLPNPIYGQINNPNGTPAGDSLVYLEIPGRSNLLSASTNSNGKWVINLANLLKNDVSSYINYTPGVDLIRISSRGRNSTATLYRPIPKFTPSIQDQTNPVQLTLVALPETATTPTLTLVPTKKASLPIITSPPQGNVKIYILLEGDKASTNTKSATVTLLKEKSLISSKKIVFSPTSSGKLQGSLSFQKSDNYLLTIKPDGYLKKNYGTYLLKTGENTLDFSGTKILGGDLNNDNAINSLDLSQITGIISRGEKNPIADLNMDGKVNDFDLSILISNYRKIGDSQ